jgi:hypothetical protein
VSTSNNAPTRTGRAEGSPTKKLRDFMTSTAGIVTALATIVTAIATISGVLYHGKSQTQRGTPFSVIATTGARAPKSAPQSSPANARILWGPGNLLVTGNGTSLSNVPPGNYQDVVGDVYSGDSSIYPFAGTTLLPWISNRQPTAQQCQYLSTTQGDPGQSVQVVPGSMICAVMTGETVAIIKVMSIDPTGSTVETSTTVWNLPSGK